MSDFHTYAHQCLAVLVAISASLALHSFRELARLRSGVNENLPESEERFHGPHAGARGLYPIYPPTGRVLARELGWEFREELLHDPARSTEMAAWLSESPRRRL